MPAEKYRQVLIAFGVKHQFDELLETSSNYVTMDHIHDAIIILGVDMSLTVEEYVYKSKQVAIKRMARDTKRKKTLKAQFNFGLGADMELLKLVNCDFTSDEMDFIGEKLQGIPAYKSMFKRCTYENIRASVKRKLIDANQENVNRAW